MFSQPLQNTAIYSWIPVEEQIEIHVCSSTDSEKKNYHQNLPHSGTSVTLYDSALTSASHKPGKSVCNKLNHKNNISNTNSQHWNKIKKIN